MIILISTIGLNMKTNDLIKIAMFPALMAATAGVTIPMVGAPITLQTLFVLLVGMILGKRNGAISMVVYLLLGIVGLPVFSGFASGLGAVMGPTGGFLISFPIAAYLVGYLKERTGNYYISALVASIVVYVVGVPWLAWQLEMTNWAALSIMFVYIPGDIVKLLVAVFISKRLEARV